MVEAEREGGVIFGLENLKTNGLFQICLGKEKKPRDDFVFETVALKTLFCVENLMEDPLDNIPLVILPGKINEAAIKVTLVS